VALGDAPCDRHADARARRGTGPARCRERLEQGAGARAVQRRPVVGHLDPRAGRAPDTRDRDPAGAGADRGERPADEVVEQPLEQRAVGDDVGQRADVDLDVRLVERDGDPRPPPAPRRCSEAARA
jgi:hypothetical protein